MKQHAAITYTRTDEAPALATESLLPIIRAFAAPAGIDVYIKDISLAARILAAFPDYLQPDQRVPDALAELGEMVHAPEANIIKLPNISASVPQLIAAIAELQKKGFAVPDYPTEPSTEADREIQARYDRVKGSAVNPVLREGNSDRRAPRSVKEYARRHPHSMGAWSPSSATHVAHMNEGDYYGSERSVTVERATTARIEFESDSGETTVLKEAIPLEAGEILDAAVMNRRGLREFIRREIEDAKRRDVLFSVHLKATMMKVSDPIIFGHVVSVFFDELFETYRDHLSSAGVNPNEGLGSLLARIADLPEEPRRAIKETISATFDRQPRLAMVNSDKGITSLHVPSDVIIDASMPAAIRAGGKMWGPDGELHDVKAVIPDRCYAGVYRETIDFCKRKGALDPATIGSVSNVGLMAQKAEEYGSHDKTFEMADGGVVRVVDADGTVLVERAVESGDIFRACQVKDGPVRDWVSLAVRRARETSATAVFWLDEDRAHDAEVIKKVRAYLPEHDTEGLDIRIMSPARATRFSLEEISAGRDTVSVTGNVLRDYLTDLFPILEVGTSAKMLSIVPLMAGGGLFETGAGGSAPKHVQQFVQEGHLRWDSLGEFLALAVSLQHFARRHDNAQAALLGDTLNDATARFLEENKSPSRRVGELDNRGSHYYLAAFWAKALATQESDAELRAHFEPIAASLEASEDAIVSELTAAQGAPVDIGGYYRPDPGLASLAMRPSATLNAIIEQ